jgi:hypothetical protein
VCVCLDLRALVGLVNSLILLTFQTRTLAWSVPYLP